ncbi:hypothetical protein [Sorangium sp. So ce1389]|uniref:hypothetical protein n=1 Tax=Sorangium sp. So ce1389 TaxID=3133336 RepID=UPI003F620035
MTKHSQFKHRIRARMAKTGEKYTTARRHILSSLDAPKSQEKRRSIVLRTSPAKALENSAEDPGFGAAALPKKSVSVTELGVLDSPSLKALRAATEAASPKKSVSVTELGVLDSPSLKALRAATEAASPKKSVSEMLGLGSLATGAAESRRSRRS